MQKCWLWNGGKCEYLATWTVFLKLVLLNLSRLFLSLLTGNRFKPWSFSTRKMSILFSDSFLNSKFLQICRQNQKIPTNTATQFQAANWNPMLYAQKILPKNSHQIQFLNLPTVMNFDQSVLSSHVTRRKMEVPDSRQCPQIREESSTSKICRLFRQNWPMSSTRCKIWRIFRTSG